MIGLRDPSGLSQIVLTLSEAAFAILVLFDGQRTLHEVRAEFRRQFGQHVSFDTLVEMVTRLEESLFLDGPAFEAHYQRLLQEYRSGPSRPVSDAQSLGLDGGAEAVFGPILAEGSAAPGEGRIVGLVAPHLDYVRGGPCYGRAYAALATRDAPRRFVILGTNHFGLGSAGSVVATGLDFATPIGTTRTDRAFVEQIEARCGDLRRYEYDHVREHSVELQVCLLQHLFGPDGFTIVPFLCPDPCAPTENASPDGDGAGLGDFARALGEEIAADEQSTVVIAGADLSHVGMFFGDERTFDEAFLAEVQARDRAILQAIEHGGASAVRECIAADQNPTRVCSAGCVSALMAALPDARPIVLGYHQAVTEVLQSCVTCAAVVFRK
jgi:AmmeMemoRadiSam system protein B